MELTKEHLLRQSELVPSRILNTPINIIGAGAIGSFTALTLAKMGFEDITVFDFDTVDTVNLSSQFYRFSDIGKPKVEALKSLIKDFTNMEIKTSGRYEDQELSGIIVSAVDSMAVRKKIFDSHKLQSFKAKFILDPRMGAEFASLSITRPMSAADVERYENTLHSDDNSIQERCTAKATMFTAIMLSGLVCKMVRDVLVRDNYTWQFLWAIAGDELIAINNQTTNNLSERVIHTSLDEAEQQIPF